MSPVHDRLYIHQVVMKQQAAPPGSSKTLKSKPQKHCLLVNSESSVFSRKPTPLRQLSLIGNPARYNLV